MNDERIVEIERKIGILTKDIILALRPDKIIEEDKFQQLYILLEELKKLMEGREFIRRKLAGLLFLLFKLVLSEADYTMKPEPIRKEAWKIGSYLLDIYDDSLFKE